MKSRLKKLAVAAGVVLVVLILLGIGLRIFFPAEKVKEMAVARASAMLGRDVSVGAVAVSLRGGLGVRMQDFSVANPDGFEEPPVLAAGSLDLKLKIRPLLRKEFRIDRLVLDRPAVHLVKRADGSDNFTFVTAEADTFADAAPASAPAGETPEAGVSFDRLEIDHGLLVFRDEAAGTGVRLGGMKLTAGLTDPGPGRFESRGYLTVDSLVVEGGPAVPPLAASLDYDISIDSRESQAEIRQATVAVDGLPLAFTGELAFPDGSFTARGRLEAAEVAVGDLLRFLTPEQLEKMQGLEIEGAVSLRTDLDFDRDRPEPVIYTGQLTVTGLKASKEGVPGDLVVPRAVADFEPDRLQVNLADGRFADQPFRAQVAVRGFADPQVEGNASGRLDLKVAQPYLPPERKGVLAGQVAFDLKFSGPAAQPDLLDYSGSLETADLSYRDPELPDDLEQLTASVKIDPRKVVIDRCEARFTSGSFLLTGRMSDPFPYFLPPELAEGKEMKTPRLTFDLRSPRLDVDRMFPAAAPPSESAPARVPTRTAVADSSLPDILCEGAFRADTLIYSQVPFTDVAGKVKMADRIFTCYDVTGKVYRGDVAGRVVIDLNDLNAPRYEGAYEASGIEVDNFVTRFAGMAGVVFGSCDMQGSFAAAGRDPTDIRNSLTLDSTAGITSGRVVTTGFVASSLGSLAGNLGQQLDREQTLRDLVTHIKVDAGKVGLDQLKTKLGTFGDFTLDGFYSFSGELDYRGVLRLSQEQTARLFSNNGALGSLATLLGDDKPERVDLPVFVKGTREKPQMGFDLAPLTKQLQDSVAAEAKDKLKEEGESALKDLFKKFK